MLTLGIGIAIGYFGKKFLENKFPKTFTKK